MEPLQNNEVIQQFMKLLEENNRQGQASDLSQLMWYMDGMSRQFEAVLEELYEVRQQLAQAQPSQNKNTLDRMAETLENKVQQTRSMLDSLWEKIAGCAARAVNGFKEKGVTALDKAVSALGVKKTLETLQENLSSTINDANKSIKKVERIGHELRSVGAHLKNAGRAMTNKETQAVDGGQEGRFQSALLAPMRTVRKMLSTMNNATLTAIGKVENLEQTAEAMRDARAARQAEKRPSIRQDLEEKKAQVAARPAPEQAVKEKEAAL